MIRREWMLLRRDRGVWIAAALLIGLYAASLCNGVVWREARRQAAAQGAATDAREYRERRQTVEEYLVHPPPPLDPVLLNLSDPRSPYVVGQAGRTARLPLPEMAAAGIGQFDLLPLDEGVSIRTRMRTVADKDGLENPLSLLAGRFDLAFVVVWLLPLFVITAMYNVVSGEREGGTLALIASQPASSWSVFLRKAVLRGGVMVAGTTAVAAAMLTWAGTWREPVRLLLWLSVVLAYGTFWWALAVRVNSQGSGSARNAVVLTSTWLAFIAVIPAALHVTVAALRPPPSRLELLSAIRDQSIDQRRDGKLLAQAWYAEHPELLGAGTSPAYDMAVLGTMTHIEQDRRTLPLERKFDDQIAAQQNMAAMLRFLSPAVAAYEAMQDIGGTSLSRHRDFHQQVREFRQCWLAWFHPRIFRGATLSPADYDAMPVFAYREEPVLAWGGRAAWGVAALGAAGLLLVVTARRRIL